MLRLVPVSVQTCACFSKKPVRPLLFCVVYSNLFNAELRLCACGGVGVGESELGSVDIADGHNGLFCCCSARGNFKFALGVAVYTLVNVALERNGSNLLVGDRGIRGLVIEIGKAMEYIQIDGMTMTVGAGTILAKAANEAACAGLGGMEFAAGIPGSMGGAVVMNAGAYGGEIKDILESATVIFLIKMI